MKNKNIKDKDIDGIVEVLDKYKEYGETAEGRETDVIHWRNFEKIAMEILSKLKENEISQNQGSLDRKNVEDIIYDVGEDSGGILLCEAIEQILQLRDKTIEILTEKVEFYENPKHPEYDKRKTIEQLKSKIKDLERKIK